MRCRRRSSDAPIDSVLDEAPQRPAHARGASCMNVSRSSDAATRRHGESITASPSQSLESDCRGESRATRANICASITCDSTTASRFLCETSCDSPSHRRLKQRPAMLRLARAAHRTQLVRKNLGAIAFDRRSLDRELRNDVAQRDHDAMRRRDRPHCRHVGAAREVSCRHQQEYYFDGAGRRPKKNFDAIRNLPGNRARESAKHNRASLRRADDANEKDVAVVDPIGRLVDMPLDPMMTFFMPNHTPRGRPPVDGSLRLGYR